SPTPQTAAPPSPRAAETQPQGGPSNPPTGATGFEATPPTPPTRRAAAAAPALRPPAHAPLDPAACLRHRAPQGRRMGRVRARDLARGGDPATPGPGGAWTPVAAPGFGRRPSQHAPDRAPAHGFSRA